MPTGYDVASDAVKIGGGAFVTLIGTLFVTLTANSREKRKELRIRRWNMIQESTVQFEAAAQTFNRLQAHYLTYRQTVALLREESWGQASSILRIEVGREIQTMQGLESVLFVVGAKESSRKISQFRDCALSMQKECKLTDTSSREMISVDAFSALWQRALKAKIDALDALENDYRSG